MLPIIIDYDLIGIDGNKFYVEIEVYETFDLNMFPEGVSGTYRLFNVDQDGNRVLFYLIDNHAPYGFHEHDGLPENHESRIPIHAKDWKEAWQRFQSKCKELTK